MMDKNKSIILFDGVCNLCNTSVQFILKRDTNNKFLFASLQSDVAKNLLLQKSKNKNNYFNLNTIILIENNVVYSKSTAILRIFKQLKFPYFLLFGIIIVPKFIRDYFYKIIAKNRYKWFGKQDVCMLPKKEYLDKFLN